MNNNKKYHNQAKYFLQIDNILYKINWRKELTTSLRVIKENEMEAILINLHSNSLSGILDMKKSINELQINIGGMVWELI